MFSESIEFTKRQIRLFLDDLFYKEEDTPTLNYVYGILEKLTVFVSLSTIILAGIYKLWIYNEAHRYLKIESSGYTSVNPVLEVYKYFYNEYPIRTIIFSVCTVLIFVGALFLLQGYRLL